MKNDRDIKYVPVKMFIRVVRLHNEPRERAALVARKVLTIIDAAIQDPIQRKALKDILRPLIWDWACQSNRSENYEIQEKGHS